MRRALASIVAVALVMPHGVSAQTAPDRMRFEWLGGVLFQGNLASATFQLDTTPFGGVVIQRSGGALDVDPSFSYGLRASYRYTERVSLQGTWLHSEGRYRVLFPALSTDPGDFDLEALLLAGFDFQTGTTGGQRAESALSIAKTDFYLASFRYEIPVMRRWLYPYASLGAGIFRQRSDGSVFRLQFERDEPPGITLSEMSGVDPLGQVGISIFSIDSTDWLLGVGAGARASISPRWGVEAELTDFIRLNADLTDIDASSTPPPDASTFRLYQTTFAGEKGLIHNWGVQLAVNYSLWPSGAPR
jgi:hypothetical protein